MIPLSSFISMDSVGCLPSPDIYNLLLHIDVNGILIQCDKMMKLWNCIRKSAPDCGKADHDVQESCHTRKAYCEECVRECGGNDGNGVKYSLIVNEMWIWWIFLTSNCPIFRFVQYSNCRKNEFRTPVSYKGLTKNLKLVIINCEKPWEVLYPVHCGDAIRNGVWEPETIFHQLNFNERGNYNGF